MKKMFKSIVYIVSILFIAWFFLSWLDIVADNTQPNPQHSEYNLFVVMTKQEEEIEGACGNPLDGTTSIRFGVISEVKADSIVFLMDEGDLQEVEVGNTADFDVDRYYCLFYQGDEVFKAWEEHW